MKKSRSVELTILCIVAASILDACKGNVDNKTCVDKDGVVVDMSNCQTSSGNPIPGHFWYYGGRGFPIGGRVSGGSYAGPSNNSFWGSSRSSSGSPVSASPISRGGFGSLGSSSGSGS